MNTSSSNSPSPAPPAGGDIRNSLMPLLISAVGVLVIVALAIAHGLDLGPDMPDESDALGGRLPDLGSGRLWPAGDGNGSLWPVRCEPNGPSYLVYVPADHKPGRSYPLVVSLHGNGLGGFGPARFVRMWGRLADRHQCIVVEPDLTTAGPLRVTGAANARAIIAVLNDAAARWEVDDDAVLLSCSPEGSADDSPVGDVRDMKIASVCTSQADLPDRLAELARPRPDSILCRIVIRPRLIPPAPTQVTVRPVVSIRAGRVTGFRWDLGKLLRLPDRRPVCDLDIRRPGTYPIRLTVTTASGRTLSTDTTLTVPAANAGGKGATSRGQ